MAPLLTLLSLIDALAGKVLDILSIIIVSLLMSHSQRKLASRTVQ